MNYMYMSIAAQDDNLGDIAIRRVIVNSYESRKFRVVLYAGNMPSDYIDAFNLSSNTKIVRNVFLFQLRLFLSCLLGRSIFILAPGPFILKNSPAAIAKRAAVLVNIIFIRCLGGQILSLGRSLHGQGRIMIALEQVILKFSNLYTVRDDRSCEVISRELIFTPDVAFSEMNTLTNHKRNRVALSFRSDRVPPLDVLSSLIARCQEAGFEPILVTQVRRDNEQHCRLAETLGIDVLEWVDATHSEQLLAVENIYAQSHAVVSNRLHSVVFGIVGGAFPVSFLDFPSGKIQSTVSPWFKVMSIIETDLDESEDYAFLNFGAPEFSLLADELEAARSKLRRTLETHESSVEARFS